MIQKMPSNRTPGAYGAPKVIPFSQGLHSCVTYCSGPENSFLTYLVWSYSCLWWKGKIQYRLLHRGWKQHLGIGFNEANPGRYWCHPASPWIYSSLSKVNFCRKSRLGLMPTKPKCPSPAGAYLLCCLALVAPKDARKSWPPLCHLRRTKICICNDCESSRKD